MLIVGARGFAKEVLEIFAQLNQTENICFYDDVNFHTEPGFYQHFKILTKRSQVEAYFKEDNRFTIGIGNPTIRRKIYHDFIAIGGKFESTISPLAHIGHYGNIIGDGCNIMTGAVITNDVKIGKGCLINLNCTIGHDTMIDDFVELSPAVNISGNCKIGSQCNIGTGAILLPKVKLGANVTVGAGAVVTKDVAEGMTVIGVPAKPTAGSQVSKVHQKE